VTPSNPVTATIHINEPPQRVFSFFNEPEKLSLWLAQWVELDPRSGGRVALDIKGTPVRGRYLEIEPARRLVLSWGHAGSDRLPPESSRVEITFIQENGGTRVNLTPTDLPEAERDSHTRGWRILFARLAAVDNA
jgi:uncharacterized protein YndB with AHSA1/START domain